ncbi:MAG TPA: nucleoside monophosphate kinase [Opitutaceae bacterium]|nr:nucleoside monophosphate kinase [Opitutaceae bacterium]
MVAISELFSLLGSPKSKLLILSPGVECSGSAPDFRSLISEHVSTEALLSAESQRDTPLGAALRRTAKSRRLPEDDTVLAVLRRWYFARRAESGFRLVGFPQTVRQALVFDEWLETRGETLDACVHPRPAAETSSAVAEYYRDRGLLVELTPADTPAFSHS